MNRLTYFRGVLFLCLLSCSICAIFLLMQLTDHSPPPLPSLPTPPPLPFTNFFYNYTLEKPLDADQTCQFPNLDPYDPSIRSHLFTARPIHCQGHDSLTDFIFVDNEAKLRINRTALNETGYEWCSLSCEYKKIIRDDGNDEGIQYGSPVIIQKNGQWLEDEFVFIRCKNSSGSTVQSGLHANVVRKAGLADRRQNSSSGAVIERERKPNVLLLVLDSMSRSNFIRQLPETYKYLVGNMSAVVLRGMTKVGENTYPNLVPILTGLQTFYYPELAPLTGRYENWPGFKHPQRYDGWPFLWKNFSRSGYATLLAEDQPQLCSFNFMNQGFLRPPTDHYMRPFWLALESSKMFKQSSRLCYGPKPKHLLQLDYVRRFVRTYRRVPHFGISMFTELGHESLNQIGAADGDLHRFLQDLHRDDSMDNTFLVMMGDHGHRLDTITKTQVGGLERRLPFMAIYTPPWFRESFPTAWRYLEENSRRLTSLRDLHFSLLDILEYARSGAGFGQHVNVVDGTTLFGPVSASRTCPHAGIPHQFCACDKEQEILEEHPGIGAAVDGLLESINAMTKMHREFCAELTLLSVNRTARVFSPVESKRNESNLEAWNLGRELRLRVSLEAKPSGGLFEGIVMVGKDSPPRIAEDIIRINRYFNQSGCLPREVHIKNPKLREFCYCSTKD